MNLHDLANDLRTVAGEIDTLLNATIPPQPCDVMGALKTLRVALPDRYISIDPPAFDWHASREITMGLWKAWDGKKSYEAPTLAELVATVLKAHQPATERDPGELQEQLQAALEPQPF